MQLQATLAICVQTPPQLLQWPARPEAIVGGVFLQIIYKDQHVKRMLQ